MNPDSTSTSTSTPIQSPTTAMWTLAIKTVGKNPSSSPPSEGPQKECPRDFTIQISPQSSLTFLRSKIHSITGLHAEQQRLIYRGRLLHDHADGNDNSNGNSGGNNGLHVCDVEGLEDGHTIHLVPRPPPSSANANDHTNNTNTTTSNPTTNANNDNDNNNNNNNDNDMPELEEANFISGVGGAGLLSALLSMGRDDDDTDNLNEPTTTSRTATSTRRRRPNSHRRTANEPRFQEPCSLEPVRQGLMTLHTMMGSHAHANHHTRSMNLHNNQSLESPLHANRWWYIGQWLDVRDTVNQWLEATVVQVLSPDEIFIRPPPTHPSHQHNQPHTHARSTPIPAMDSAIGTNELSGRLRLLLEPSPNPQERTLADLNDDPSLIGLTERQNNEGIQLLLVHYNGWPHRWDEWIRSDSERIRPFRTRSRHVLNRNHLCPVPESSFTSAPDTFVKSEDDEVERKEVLPEIFGVLEGVQDIFAQALKVEENERKKGSIRRMQEGDKGHGIGSDDHAMEDGDGNHNHNNHLRPLSKMELLELTDVMGEELRPEIVEQVLCIVQGENEVGKDMEPADIDVEALDRETQWKLKNFLDNEMRVSGLKLVQDHQLPWIAKHPRCDRDGDGDNVGDNDNGSSGENRGDGDGDGDGGRVKEDGDRNHENETPDFDKKSLEALAPLLDRLGRILIDAAPHVATFADSLPDPPPQIPSQEVDKSLERMEHVEEHCEDHDGDAEENANARAGEEGGVNELESRELRPSWSQSHSVVPSLFESDSDDVTGRNESENNASTNPDYVDFVHGFINHRNTGSPRRGAQTRNRSEGGSIGSTLLSGFLASALRGDPEERNRNGNNGPRVVRVGGNGNGGPAGNPSGIDIHIHAIVTGGNGAEATPDFNNIANLMSFPRPSTGADAGNNDIATSNANANANANVNAAPSAPSTDEEDMGLFENLYSENPATEPNNDDPSDSWRAWNVNENEVEIEDGDADNNAGTDSTPVEENQGDEEMSEGSLSIPGLMDRQDDSSTSGDEDSVPRNQNPRPFVAAYSDGSSSDSETPSHLWLDSEDIDSDHNSMGPSSQHNSNEQSLEPDDHPMSHVSEQEDNSLVDGDAEDTNASSKSDNSESYYSDAIESDGDDELESLPPPFCDAENDAHSFDQELIDDSTQTTYGNSNDGRPIEADVEEQNTRTAQSQSTMMSRLFGRALGRNSDHS